MRTLIAASLLMLLLVAGTTTAWWAMNHYTPGVAGTPAHAGAISNGRPEDCTNIALNVKPRQIKEHRVVLQTGELLRGTFEANGGFGRVDILLRVKSPQNLEILASPRTEIYDFQFPARSRGEYTFVFDNRYSLLTAKAVGLFYCVDKPEAGLPLAR